jgi:hypothetical protein
MGGNGGFGMSEYGNDGLGGNTPNNQGNNMNQYAQYNNMN